MAMGGYAETKSRRIGPEKSFDMNVDEDVELTLANQIEKATDCLLLREFEECILVCKQGIALAKPCIDQESGSKALECLCVLIVQAFAELDRWREVLPFITQEYSGIEGCPAKVVQLLVLLHSKVGEFAQCHAIANIWLKTETNQTSNEYTNLVELYTLHVLAKQQKWQDIKRFLRSCAALPAEDFHRISQLSEQLQLEESAESRQLEKTISHKRSRKSKSDELVAHQPTVTRSETPANDHHNQTVERRGGLVEFVRRFGLFVSSNLRFINLGTIYKIIFVGICVYLITIKANTGDLMSNIGNVGSLGQAVYNLFYSLLGPLKQQR